MVKLLSNLNKKREISEEDLVDLFKNILISVQKLHHANFSHQHISPKTIGIKNNNIHLIHHYAPLLFDKTSEITNQIIPFAHNPNYLSPEQKAITKLKIDYRCDIFSLGILFYWLLTDSEPITFNDGSYIFTFPKNIKQNIKVIIEKMTAKLPEDRYQSISGILNDLNCNKVLLYIGKDDHPEHLHFDHYLFGRQSDAHALLEKIKEDSSCILIEGEAGSGKTALIREALGRSNTYTLASGKTDLITHTSYSTLGVIFSDLIHQAQSKISLIDIRKELQDRLGQNFPLLTHLVPELRLYPDNYNEKHAITDPLHLKQRLVYTYTHFLIYMTSFFAKIICFIDDIQWGTKDDCDIIQKLTQPPLPNISFVLAYRPSEITHKHPLNKVIQHNFPTIKIHDLNKEDVSNWIQYLFKCNRVQGEELANHLHQKALGNPFFTKTLLKTLYDKHIINYDFSDKKWNWNIGHLQKAKVSDNVVQLILDAFHTLPTKTQQLLHYASCLGTDFSIQTLANTLNLAETDIIQDLKAAEEHFFIHREALSCTFSHDRILRQIYFNMSDPIREHLHYTIAATELKAESPSLTNIQICDHFSHSTTPIPKKIILQIIELMIAVAKEKKLNSGFHDAKIYLSTCLRMMSTIDPSIELDKDLIFIIHINYIETLYLTKEFVKAKDYIEKLKKTKLTHSQYILILTQELDLLNAKEDFHESLKIGFQILSLQKIHLHSFTNTLKNILTLINLLTRPITTLINPTPTQKKEIHQLQSIINKLIPIAYRCDQNTMKKLMLKSVQLSKSGGVSDTSSLSLLYVAIYMWHYLGFRKKGLAIIHYAYDIQMNSQNNDYKGQFLEIYATFSQFWTQPLKNCIKTLIQAIKFGEKTGDYTYTNIAHNNLFILKNYTNIKKTNTEQQKSQLSHICAQIDNWSLKQKEEGRYLQKESLELESHLKKTNDYNLLNYLYIKKTQYLLSKNKYVAGSLYIKKMRKTMPFIKGAFIEFESIITLSQFLKIKTKSPIKNVIHFIQLFKYKYSLSSIKKHTKNSYIIHKSNSILHSSEKRR